MEKIDFTPYINDLQKGGAIIEKIQQGTATEEERIKAKELIWTIGMQNSNEGTFDRFAYATKRPCKVNQCKTDNDFRLQKRKINAKYADAAYDVVNTQTRNDLYAYKRQGFGSKRNVQKSWSRFIYVI